MDIKRQTRKKFFECLNVTTWYQKLEFNKFKEFKRMVMYDRPQKYFYDMSL